MYLKKNSKMKVKGKRTLKNGAIAGYVYYSKEKKWKWRIIGRDKKQKGGNGNYNLNHNLISNTTVSNDYTNLRDYLVDNYKHQFNIVDVADIARIEEYYDIGISLLRLTYFNNNNYLYKKYTRKYKSCNLLCMTETILFFMWVA